MADLRALHAHVVAAQDQAARTEALAAYKHFVDQHLANLDVVLFARDKAATDKRLGDAQWFEWLHRGIAGGLMNTAGGRSTGDAYVVQTLGEESYVLRRHKADIMHSEPLRVGVKFYNIHTLRMGDGRVKRLYIDITLPMAYLINREGKAPKALDLTR